MNCRECTENLTAYLDEELSPNDLAHMRAHLDTCASCRAELRSFEEAADLVQSNTRDLEIGSETWNAIYDRILNERPSSRFGFLQTKWNQALAMAAVVAALALGYLFYQQNQHRKLDEYISQYVKSREAGFRMQATNSFMPNPFSEVRQTSDTNPFRVEGQ